MVTQAWYDTFPQCQLHNLVADRSDHYPILLKLQESNRRKTMREFKFENSWLQEEELETIVNGGWNKEGGSDVLSKFKNCSDEMNDASRKHEVGWGVFWLKKRLFGVKEQKCIGYVTEIPTHVFFMPWQAAKEDKM
ncbi:endonuclease/exonuclease/phosphatase family protein, partial [Trifolium medium]|nr:endonuclease/exonuclease/phosphatase family protein [Trifolium medium]